MKNAIKNNPIQQVAKTLTGSQGGKVKVVSDKPSLTKPEILGLVCDAGKAYIECKTHSESAEKALTVFNEKALALHSGGVRLVDGRAKCETTKLVKQAFIDSLGDLAPKTKQNYYELFFKVVNTGKAISKFKPDSAKAKGSKGNQSKPVEILDLLAKVYNHAKFEKTFSPDTVIEIRDILAKAKYLD